MNEAPFRHAAQVARMITLIAPTPLAFIYGQTQLQPYLEHAFRSNQGYFGHARHRLLEEDGQCVGMVASFSAREKFQHDVALLDSILRFYPGLSGVGVIRRLMRSVAHHPRPRRATMLLYNLAVAPQARGRGLGSQLLREVIASARAAGHRRVELDVDCENGSAIEFYRAHGFKVTARMPGACHAGFRFSDHFRMTLSGASMANACGR